MPLGAARLNTLSRVQAVAAAATRGGFVNVTTNGGAQLTNAQYKFRTGTRGGSIVFDGSGDYLSLDAIPLSGDYTIETWIRLDTVASSTASTIIGGNTTSSYESLQVYEDDVTWNTPFLVANSVISANTWHHIAVSRSGTSVKLFVDGTQRASGTDSSTVFSDDSNLYIGRDAFTNAYADGYMDEIRISDTARYTGNFTVPSAAFTPDVNTLLLLHGDGPVGSTGNFHMVDDIGDLRPIDIHIQPNVTQGGSAPSISTAQSKFGGSSLVSYDNEGHCEFASPEFGDAYTIEFWFRANNTSGDQFMAGVWGGSPHGGFTWSVYLNGSTVRTYVWPGSVAYVVNNVNVGTASANTWHHFAISWDGSTYRTFLDGTMGATVTSSTAPNYEQWSTTWVGTVGGTTSNFAGYIDEYRMSDIARYTSSFTAPTSAFTNDANTKVLLHFNGTNGATTTTDDAS